MVAGAHGHLRRHHHAARHRVQRPSLCLLVAAIVLIFSFSALAQGRVAFLRAFAPLTQVHDIHFDSDWASRPVRDR